MNLISKAKPNPAKNSSNTRIFLLLAGITIFVALVGFRMFYLQVVNREYYKNLAANQHTFDQTILPKRGDIYLTSSLNGQGLLVATNVSKNLVYVATKEITDRKTAANRLGKILEMDSKDVLARFDTGTENYAVIKKQISEEQSKAVEDLDIKGIYLEPETIRYYPEGSLAGNVLGFLGYKGNQRSGQYGIEGNFEAQLAGIAGQEGLEKGLSGAWITFATRNLTPAHDGDDITLTIDPAIQFQVQEVLRRTVTEHEAKSGSVVVINPKTGSVMAMASYPDFDPNFYNKVEDAVAFSNLTVSNDYEPGSVFKPLTMAMAVNENKVTPETTYFDTGEVELDDFKIKNSDGQAHGEQTMIQVLDESLNTGAVWVQQQQVGQESFKKYIQNFGFGKITGIELPGESKGDIENLNKKGKVFYGTASYGQGLTATPMQIVQAFTAIANGGKLVKPYVVSKVVHANGDVTNTDVKQLGKVLESRAAATISAMMVDVVENGHGKKAGVKGYYIAGKTGTAQVSAVGRAGYDANKTIGSFIGFGPVDNPAFLMLVRIDEPKDVKYAETTAAPAFGEIASFILDYLQVPPTRE